jgi:FkbH-like protein
MYKEQFQRETVKKSFVSIEEYLSTLEIEIEISKDIERNIPRISQLTQKTNQFNLNTYRYTENQIEEMMHSSDTMVFNMFVKDKFGESGLTGVCIVRTDEQNAIIDTLLMSCRIIGRNIENAFINTIINALKEMRFEQLHARFTPSSKNSQVAKFYDTMGFTVISENHKHKEYNLNLAEASTNKVEYIKVTDEINNNLE